MRAMGPVSASRLWLTTSNQSISCSKQHAARPPALHYPSRAKCDTSAFRINSKNILTPFDDVDIKQTLQDCDILQVLTEKEDNAALADQ